MCRQIFLLSILVFCSASLVFPQTEQKAFLVDEFGGIHCDDFLARVDIFFIQLHAVTDAKGLVVISGAASNKVKVLDYEQLTRSAISQGRYEFTRISSERRESGNKLKIQFWIVPKGVSSPELPGKPANAQLPPGVWAFNIRNDMSQICDPEPLEPLAGQLLDNHPAGSIYIVINYGSHREQRAQLNEATKLVKSYPKGRIRYLLRKSGTPWNDYWFVVEPITRRAFYGRLKRDQAWSY